MKKIPKYVKIGGHRIKIEQYKEILKDKKGKNTYWGLCLHAYKIIRLYTSMAWSNIEQVFLHEVIHEISMQRDARLSEKQVRYMAEGIYEFLKTNDITFSNKDDKDYRLPSNTSLLAKENKKRKKKKARK